MTAADKRMALIAYHAAGARLGRAGDLAALVPLCGPRLLAHARRLSDDDDTARDIVQEAWVGIARALPGLRDEGAFLAFALRIVTRVAAREVGRRQRRRVADQGFAQTQAEVVPAPSGGDLDAAIAALPVAQRSVLSLFYLDGLSVAQIADVLSIPPGTVKTRLMHARARLRALLQGEPHGHV